MKVISPNEIGKLITLLRDAGFTVAGPKIRDGAIVYDELESADDLPVGYTEVQKAAEYRLEKRNDNAMFGYVVGPHSWKKYMFPPKLKLWEAERNGKSFTVKENNTETPKYAFLGVRSCELKAILIQDKVFNNGLFADSFYNKVREGAFIIAISCSQAGGTCFCVSMNTGPKVKSDFDIALTEIINENEHYFVLEEGSARGEEFASKLESRNAEENDLKAAEAAVKNAEDHMGRELDTSNIHELLLNNLEHMQWNDVASRCLSCANCTLVCPTCFCSNVEDVTDLTGDHAERWRSWDSCFTMDYAKVAGGNFRPSPKARYRQWMTHKLATWIDQFGSSGCVGCGRCITWCPVGIDITEEVKSIRNKLPRIL